MNYARRQRYRRLSHAGKAALASAVAALLGLVGASAGAPALAGLLLLTAVGLGLYACHWLSLARRSRISARSEDEVQSALAVLQAEGWRLQHSLRWQGRGDIDSVAIAPTGVAVAIETKTRTYDGRHLARVHQQAAWLSRHRRRRSRHGALAVLCLVRMRGVERLEHDVLVVSIDRLTVALRGAARMRPPTPITAVDDEHHTAGTAGQSGSAARGSGRAGVRSGPAVSAIGCGLVRAAGKHRPEQSRSRSETAAFHAGAWDQAGSRRAFPPDLDPARSREAVDGVEMPVPPQERVS